MLAFIATEIVAAGRSELGDVALAMFSGWELLVVLAIAVLLFGANKLPQLGKGLGEAIGNFKSAQKAGEQAAEDAVEGDAKREEIDATPRLSGDESDTVDAEKQSTSA